jgi:amino acid adenylation domain-containing protein/non-ribosomal peptide synthase protein (TIGR01720 family)
VTVDNLAYVIYTSGSTGQPKGAMNTHRGLCNRLRWMQQAYHLTPADRVLQKTPFSFDVSVWEFFWPLMTGARLVMARPGGHQDSAYLVQLVAAQQITTLHFVPSMLGLFLEEPRLETCASLRRVLCSGEALPFELQERFFARLDGELHNLYGPTEASIDVTAWACQRQSQSPSVPIGRPIANTQIYLLDAQLQPVPIGVAGELHIGGVGLARGYLHRPDLTAEKFIPHPFSPEPGARLYKTGDLARYLPEGAIEFLGRLDQQVKIRGFRIELGEIEAVLRHHPAVGEVVVLARDEGPGEKRLVAYVVPLPAQSVPLSELRSFLQAKLPDYMVPAAFVLLPALPLTPNGKLDRRALPPPEQGRPELKRAYVAPRTPTEEVVAGLWAQVLGIEQVGVEDNFFELGGHSLLATQVLSRLRTAFQVELPLRALFEAPTVAGLAQSIEAARQAEQGLSAPPLGPVPRAGALPLSFAQQRLWFLDQLVPDNPFYNMPSAVRLQGQLDVAALVQSLNEVVRRHEALRTTFATVEGQPVQVIAPTLTVPLPVVDLSELPEAEREAEVRRLVVEEARRPFALAQGPLVRAQVLRLGAKEHVVLLMLHHIVSDAWSMEVLLRELGVLYAAFAQGQPSPLPELPVQYADFALWQRQWLQGEVLEAQQAYWQGQLREVPVLELPTDHPRPALPSFRGATYPFVVPTSLAAALKALSQREGATLFMTLLAAFQILLARYSRQEDIVVGSPIANRTRLETEGLIGFFVNTLVLRTDLRGNPSFRELLGRVREVCLGAYAHQDLPFEQLVEELQPVRDLSRTPLVQVMFVLQNASLPALEFPGFTLTPVEVDRGAAHFDLTLSLLDTEQGVRGWFNYNLDLFDAATIARMAGHWQTLLEGLVTQPEQRLSELPLLTAAECDQLLVEWNDTKGDYSQDVCVHQLFEWQVERTPDAVAVVCEDQHLTYRELNERANRLAHYLRALGVGPEALVGLCVERSLEMIIGLLGILKAGGAYVPLDPTYPQERIAFMLADAQVAVLVTQHRLVAGLPEHAAQVVCLDADWLSIAHASEENPVSDVTADHLAYVIYTSGSTGQPKGVLVTHHNLVHSTSARTLYYRDPVGSFLLLSSFAFDSSVAGIFWTLCQGGALCLAPPRFEQDLAALPTLIAAQRISHLLSLPSLYGLILAQAPPYSLASLRTVIVAGEPCPGSLVNTHLQQLPEVSLFNEYGPTEGTVWSSVYQVGAAPAGAQVPIGRPIANTQLYLLDDRLQPVPVGVPGELYIGGHGVASGYLQRPELTAERFLPHPFSPEPGRRLYKTGDLARYLPDGNIEFLGRSDQQVKLRGFRIELGEIEAVLSRHPAVREAVVLAREDAGGDKRLVAYVVPEQGQGLSLSELRSFLRTKLPDYMVPSALVVMETLPLTPSGKVDRRALPAPDRARSESLERSFVAPRTPTEEVLGRIWAQVLGLERVGVYDNFFELGGDSILSLQIIARANQAGLRLTPRQIFQHQTIAELAIVAGTTRAIQAEQGPVTGSVPLTPIQQWFFAQNLPDPHHFNQTVLLEVHQPLDPTLLAQAVRHLLLHHDALRLRFVREESGWQQSNAGPDEAALFTRMDLSALPETEQGSAVEVAATELQASLNLMAGPLVRVALFHLGEAKPSRLLLTIHHLVVDGVSWRVLLEDLLLAYHQLNRGVALQLPPKTTSFKQWAERLSEYAQSGSLQPELDYWLAESRSTVVPLPVDYPAGANIQASSQTVAVSLSEEETRALLQEAPKAYHTQINDVLLTALAQACARWTGVRSLLIDLEGHGREELFEDVDLSRTVGWFTVVFPVLLELGEASGPGETLKTIKEQLRRVPNHGIGYGLLRYLSREKEIAEKLRARPQAQVSFNYLGQLDQVLPEPAPFGPAGEPTGPAHSPRGNRRYLLEVNGSVVGGQLRLFWTYSENVHRRSTIESLAQECVEALRLLIAHCQSPEAGGYTPSDFPLARLDEQKLSALSRFIEKIDHSETAST